MSVALIALGTGIAGAADLPAAPIYALPSSSWTGFYVGGNLGGAWADNTRKGVFIGGGQLGYNYQIGYIVLGVEGDFDWTTNSNGNSAVLGPFATAGASGQARATENAVEVTSNNKWISTLSARFGLTMEELFLFYGKAGAGFVGNNGLTVTNVTTGQSFSGSSSNIAWLVGGGLEFAFTPHWTMKVEYDYLGLSNQTFTVPATVIPLPVVETVTTGNRNVQMVKVGFNYLFNWGNPAAALSTSQW